MEFKDKQRRMTSATGLFRRGELRGEPNHGDELRTIFSLRYPPRRSLRLPGRGLLHVLIAAIAAFLLWGAAPAYAQTASPPQPDPPEIVAHEGYRWEILLPEPADGQLIVWQINHYDPENESWGSWDLEENPPLYYGQPEECKNSAYDPCSSQNPLVIYAAKFEIRIRIVVTGTDENKDDDEESSWSEEKELDEATTGDISKLYFVRGVASQVWTVGTAITPIETVARGGNDYSPTYAATGLPDGVSIGLSLIHI